VHKYLNSTLEELVKYAKCLTQKGSNRYPFIVFATKVGLGTIEFTFNGTRTLDTFPDTILCHKVGEIETTHTPSRKRTLKIHQVTFSVDFPTGKTQPVHIKVSYYFYELEIGGERVNVVVTEEDMKKVRFLR